MSRSTSPSRRFDKLGAFLDLAAAPGDSPELRRRKRMAVVLPAMTVLVVPFFVAGFLLVGQWHAALPPSLAVIGMLGQLAWLRGTRRLGAVPAITLAMVLLMTGAGHILGGGFVGSGAVILWSIFAPIWALALVGRQAARVTMLGFVALLLALALAEPQLRGLGSPLPAAAQGPMLALNFLLVGVSLFVVLGRLLLPRRHDRPQLGLRSRGGTPVPSDAPNDAGDLVADPPGVDSGPFPRQGQVDQILQILVVSDQPSNDGCKLVAVQLGEAGIEGIGHRSPQLDPLATGGPW